MTSCKAALPCSRCPDTRGTHLCVTHKVFPPQSLSVTHVWHETALRFTLGTKSVWLDFRQDWWQLVSHRLPCLVGRIKVGYVTLHSAQTSSHFGSFLLCKIRQSVLLGLSRPETDVFTFERHLILVCRSHTLLGKWRDTKELWGPWFETPRSERSDRHLGQGWVNL